MLNVLDEPIDFALITAFLTAINQPSNHEQLALTYYAGDDSSGQPQINNYGLQELIAIYQKLTDEKQNQRSQKD